MELHIKRPSDLKEKELEQIQSLIILGGEVSSDTLRERLLQSSLIAFFEDNNNVIATATIKKPLNNYKTKVFSKSKTNLEIHDYPFELGYVIVDSAYRGNKLASRLCGELCRILLSSKLFATTKVDNRPMQTILETNYFKKIGEQYPNRENSNYLELYIKREIMDTYNIDLKETIIDSETLWTGSIMKLSKPVPKQNTISTAESIARKTKELAEKDILDKAVKLDFIDNEIIFLPTRERLNSVDDLKQRLGK